jgi:glutamine---fructose-6-phosphate transaminase (isomerizing)
MAAPSGVLAEVRPDGPDSMGVDIAEGPDTAIATLRAVRELQPRIAPMLAGAGRVVLAGTGASLAMARMAAPIWRRGEARGAQILVRQATEIALGGLDGWNVEPTDLVVATSQSGASPETLAAARLARAAGASVLAVTAHPDSPLASTATLTVPLASGREQGAATKSALSSLAALLAIPGGMEMAHGAQEDLRERLAAAPAWRDATAHAPSLAAARHTWLLGFGLAEGLAAAAALLWHEKVIRPATAATPSEFRHGLVEAVEPTDVVVLITHAGEPTSTGGARYLDRLRGELGELGVDMIELRATAHAPGHAALELLYKLQHLARATALAAGTYREEFAILRRVVKPANDLPG